MSRGVARYALAALVLLLPSVAKAQSLGDAAAREKARRKEEEARAKGKKTVYTNDDLKAEKLKGASVGTLSANGASAPESREPPSVRPRGNDDSQAEQAWKAKGKVANDTLKRVEDRLASLQSTAAELLTRRLQSTDTNEILRLSAEQQGILNEIETVKQEISAAKKDLETLQEEARRAGVPSQWLEPQP